jgi:hypothetical protein
VSLLPTIYGDTGILLFDDEIGTLLFIGEYERKTANPDRIIIIVRAMAIRRIFMDNHTSYTVPMPLNHISNISLT